VYGNYNVLAVSTLPGEIASLEDTELLPQRKHKNARLRDETVAWLWERACA